ncbi:MAG: phage virion morphogenesis protein [Treponema sp.]|nr:phage virion morphogenesis protein [Treponema sp.]
MAGAVVEIGFDELRALCSRLNKMALTPSERKDLLGSVGEEMITQTKDRFAEKKTPDGDDWADIAQSTKDYYKRKFGTANPYNGILWRQGGLMDSLTQEVGSWSVLVGATKIYAAVHQYGYMWKNIPARTYIGLSADDKTEIVGIILGFLERRGL